jgi:integration host factor subunit alpha
MTKKSVTRSTLARLIKQEVGIKTGNAANIVDDIFATITEQLLQHKKVKIRNLGSLSVRYKNSRVGRNPRTLEVATIAARYVVTFRVSSVLRNKVVEYAAYRS